MKLRTKEEDKKMETRLFDQFASVIRAGAAADDARLRLAVDGKVEVYYAPFEALNPQARLVLVGITPGRVQASNALTEAGRQLAAGATSAEAMRRAKEVGAFSGPMRSNLTSMLDHIGLAKWLELRSFAQLFADKAKLLQTASVLQFPVFVGGENYNGNPDPMRTPILKRFVHEHFAQLGAALPQAVFIPLGPVPTRVMEVMVQGGHFRGRQVLAGLPHPSGANAERIAYFLGRKQGSELSAKTNAGTLDAARRVLQTKVAALA
jgi:hypothetical protein